MPFTASHVAAVLPFLRRPVTRVPFVPSALVIGSMVPDAAMFIPRWPSYATTHSATGILTVDTPATCVAVLVFYLLFRAPLIALLPAGLGGRIPGPPRLPTPRRAGLLLLVPLAAAVGATTHAFWDSFTHERSGSIWGWEWLSATPIAGLTGYHLLQYASSLLGLLAVAGWSLLKLHRSSAVADPSRSALPPAVRHAVWAALIAITATCAVLWPTRLHRPQSFNSAAFWTGLGALTGLSVALTAFCAAFTLIKIKNRS